MVMIPTDALLSTIAQIAGRHIVATSAAQRAVSRGR